MPGRALAPRLPAAAHVLGAARQEQVVHRAEEGIGAGERRGRRSRRRRGRRSPPATCAPRVRVERRARPVGRDAAETRKRATPPSGKMLSRTCVTGAPAVAANRFCASGRSGICGSSSLHSVARAAPSSGVPRWRAQALDRGERRAVADEVLRVDVEADDRAGRAQLAGRTSRSPGPRLRRLSQPSIHLPRSVYLPSMNTPRPGCEQVLLRRRRTRRWRRAPCRRGSPAREIDQAGERGSAAVSSLTPPRSMQQDAGRSAPAG